MKRLADPRAFPNDGCEGMDLRDWFAGQALIGLADSASGVKANDSQPTPVEVASQCYLIADAMLRASGRKFDE